MQQTDIFVGFSDEDLFGLPEEAFVNHGPAVGHGSSAADASLVTDPLHAATSQTAPTSAYATQPLKRSDDEPYLKKLNHEQ